MLSNTFISFCRTIGDAIYICDRHSLFDCILIVRLYDSKQLNASNPGIKKKIKYNKLDLNSCRWRWWCGLWQPWWRKWPIKSETSNEIKSQTHLLLRIWWFVLQWSILRIITYCTHMCVFVFLSLFVHHSCVLCCCFFFRFSSLYCSR